MMTVQKPDKFDWTTQVQQVMKPLEYAQKVPSKHHKLIIPAFNYWLQVPDEKVEQIEHILYTVHAATLLLDDIHDDSAVRYGVPAAHRVFGVALTSNAAVMAFTTMEKKIYELGHPLAPKIYLERMLEMGHGQGIDIYWGNYLVCPTEAAHYDMIKKKAASFFVMMVELLQLFSAIDKDYTKLAMNIGMYYCMLDDYYNLFNPKALHSLAEAKQGSCDHAACSDITECKFTLPMIHAMQFTDVANELFDIFKQRTSDPVLKNHFVALLKKHHSDEYTRDVLRALETDIRTEIDRFGGNVTLTELIDDLSLTRLEFHQER